MLTCKDASRLISRGQELPLSSWDRLGLRLHLWMCANCRRFERQLAMLRHALRMLGRRAEEEDDGANFPPEARERIRKTLAERDKPS